MKKPQFGKSLEERFKGFLDSRTESQNIDEMDISKEHQQLKRADYLLNGNIIVELKSLENDPSHKVEKILKPHREREDFPLHYWETPLQDILKELHDGDKINHNIFFSVTKSVQHCFEKADKQIKDTKTIIGEPNATGVLAILNEQIDILEPKIIAYAIRYMMDKRNKDGSYRYRNIHFVYFMSEAHFQKIGHTSLAMPLMIIDGPDTKDHLHAIKQFEQYNREWGKYNNTAVFNDKNSPVDRLVNAFKAFDSSPPENNLGQIQRQELWRREYRKNPYLQNLEKEDFITYGQIAMELLAPCFLKGFPEQPKQKTLELLIMWAHFIEEAQSRNFNMKELKVNIDNIKTS